MTRMRAGKKRHKARHRMSPVATAVAAKVKHKKARSSAREEIEHVRLKARPSVTKPLFRDKATDSQRGTTPSTNLLASHCRGEGSCFKQLKSNSFIWASGH